MHCLYKTQKALVRMYACKDSSEPSLLAFVISTEFSCAGSFILNRGSYMNAHVLLNL